MPFRTSYYNDTEAEMVDLVNRCKKERKETRRKEGKAFGTLNRRIDARRSMTQSVLVNVWGGQMPTSGCRKRCSWQDRVKQREGERMSLYAADGAVTLSYHPGQHSAKIMSRASICSAE